MTVEEFDKTGFSPGLKVKINETGKIHDLIGDEFDNKLVEDEEEETQENTSNCRYPSCGCPHFMC